MAKFSFRLVLFLGLFSYAGSAENHSMLACVGGTVYPSPTAEPIKDAAVLMEEGKITAVEPGARFKLPAAAQVLDCKGKFIVAGFWNSHIHFETGWHDATSQPADALSQYSPSARKERGPQDDKTVMHARVLLPLS